MSEIINEAHRVTTICNACRYCEGFCAVFPAMELRRTFTDEELKYFSNLCHNCRGCYYCCQYAPPHEFQLNYPKAMAELRKETYSEFAWPGFMGKIFKNNGMAVFGITLAAIIVLLAAAIGANGVQNFFTAYTGAESFYNIIPYGVMLVVFTLIFLFSLFCLGKSMAAMWKITGSKPEVFFSLKNHIQAVKDVLVLRYLDGNGEGCNYPDDRFSFIRRKFHHATFYGFAGCFVATLIAFFYDHVMGWPAPYDFASLPVFFGTVGGIALCIGTGGLAYLKFVMDPEPYDASTTSMDNAFTSLLFLVSLSGLLLLFMRSTSLMGLMLCIHLGLVLGLFLTMPCSKFVHMVYRYAALVRNAQEQRDGKA